MVIAGGGFAALEAALALHTLADDRVELTLISPRAELCYRPAATSEVFGTDEPLTYDLRQIAADLGMRYHQFALEAVSAVEQRVRLGSGLVVDYDALIVATGTRAVTAVPGALTFRDQRDIPRFRRLLDQVAVGRVNRLVFAVPSRRTWALPVYELALVSSLHAIRNGAETEIVIVTPETRPLAIFGDETSRAVAGLLGERGIRFLGESTPDSVSRDGALTLQFDAPVRADRVIALPELQGTRIAGIPSSWSGFIPTDLSGRVEGLANLYAAGDVTTYPIKQGGVAAQQADAVAHAIAAELGVPVKEGRDVRVLRARLLTGDGALVLRTELDALGNPTTASVHHHESRQSEQLKVFGRYLTPYLSLYGSRPAADATAV